MPKLAVPLELLAIFLLALLVLQWPVRRLMRWLLGPLFALEMTRLARRSGNLWGRCAYAVALFILLYNTFPKTVDVNVEHEWGLQIASRQAENFAERFSELFLTVQSIMVLVFVPIYFGGAVSEEKERRSLDFLLSSQLTSREIVLGKYAARVISMTYIVLAGMPVLALTAIWGGVEFERVAVTFAATVISILSLGAVTILCSVMNRRTVGASGWAYVLTVGLSAFISTPIIFARAGITPPLITTRALGRFEPIAFYAGIHCLVAVAALILAVLQLRRRAQPPPSMFELLRKPGPIPQIDLPPVLAPAPVATWRPIRGDAFLWKERHVGRPNEPFFEAIWLYVAGILLVVAVPAIFARIPEISKMLDPVYLVLFGLFTGGMCLGLILDLAAGVTREREQRTLESLLSIPVSRSHVLLSKIRGAFYRRIRWLIAIIWLMIVCLISGSPSRGTEALAALIIAGQLIFVASLALLVSVLARNTLRAYVISLLIVASVFAATGAMAYFKPESLQSPTHQDQFVMSLNPIMAGWLARRRSLLPELGGFAIANIVFSTFLYVVAGVVMAAIAHWRFRRSERYT